MTRIEYLLSRQRKQDDNLVCFIPIFTILIICTVLLVGCGSAPTHEFSLQNIRDKESYSLYKECQNYYRQREFMGRKLLFPKPSDICNKVRELARKGQPIPWWRI